MKMKIKIALVGWSLQFLYTRKLCHYLSTRHDVEVHVVTIGDKTEYIKKGDIHLHTIELKRPSSIFVFLNIPFIKHKLMEINPDIIHVIQQTAKSMAVVLLRDKYPTVLTVVGIVAMESKYYSNYKGILDIYTYLYRKLAKEPIERYVLSKIPNIIAESSHNKNIIAEITNSKIFVVPDGIEFGLIQKIQLDPNKKLDIFYIGNLYAGKGVDLLIKAVSVITKSIPDLGLAIAGKGSHENELRDLVCKLNLEDHVKFLGFISEEEKFQYYKACKFTVVPSRWDFSPITIYEAMACGKPVVASTETNSEILKDGETGFLFESENVEGLVNRMLELLKDDVLRERLGRTAMEKARECDWGKIAEMTVAVYREVITDFHERKAKIR
jgi:1,4-alpha-glucan branching enzyme